jgi:hypothetical protein
MSAYALPGLFPPLPFFFDSDHVNVSISIDDSLSTQRLDYSSLEKEEKVEHEPPTRTRMLASSEATLLSAPSCCCSVDQIDVSVKDARLDILQWIHSLTSSAAPLLSANAAARKQQRSPARSRNSALLLNPDVKLASGGVAAEVSPLSSKERAMQFEMSISWNGRQYIVVRSLERLRYLREELVAELQMLDDIKLATAGVPEMPNLPDNGGCANQSFALLQGLLRAHMPAMESWLNQVFRLLPHINDSATLTNFVLEPVCLLQNSPVPKAASEYSLPSLLRRSSLASISEDDEEE